MNSQTERLTLTGTAGAIEALRDAPQLVEGQSRGFVVAGRKVLAVRRDGRAYAYLNRCPHRGLALEWRADDFLMGKPHKR